MAIAEKYIQAPQALPGRFAFFSDGLSTNAIGIFIDDGALLELDEHCTDEIREKFCGDH